MAVPAALVSQRLERGSKTLTLRDYPGDTADYQDRLMLLGRIYNTVFNALETPVELDETNAWGFCYANVLQPLYGMKDALITVDRMLKSGVDGGLRRVLNDIAGYMLQDFSRKAVKGKVIKFWMELSDFQREIYMSDYYHDHRSLLPPIITEEGPEALFYWFPEVLEAHPTILQYVRRSLRDAAHTSRKP